MSVTVARLMAEVGINSADFTKGLRNMRQDIVDVANDVADFNRQVTESNRAVEASNAKVLASQEALTKATETAEKAIRSRQNAEERLLAAIERREKAEQRVVQLGRITSSEAFRNSSPEDQAPIVRQQQNAQGRLTSAQRGERIATNTAENARTSETAAIRAQQAALAELQATEARAAIISQEAAAATAEETAARQRLAISAEEAKTAIIQQMIADQEALLATREFAAGVAEVVAVTRARILEDQQLAAVDAALYEEQIAGLEATLAPIIARQRAEQAAAAAAAERAAADKAQLAAFVSNFDGMGRRAKEIGQTLSLSLSLPIAAVGVMSTKASIEYEFAMGKIAGLTNATTEDVHEWHDAMLQMGETGKTPKELAEGMFFVSSAGQHGAQALDLLTRSAKASETGMGDTATVAKTASNMIYNYGERNLSAAHAMDVLTSIIREGKVPIDAVAQSFSRILPITAQLGVSVEDTAAAIASMTRAGFPAERSVTSLTTALTKLMVGGTQISKELKNIGLSIDQVQEMIKPTGLGLYGTLDLLEKKEEEHGKTLANLFPTARAIAGVLSIVGQNAETNAGIFDRLNHSLGASDKAWNSIKDTSKVALDTMKASVEDAGVAIGTALAPMIVDIAHAVSNLANTFAGLSPEMQKAIVVFLGLVAVVGPVVYLTGQLIVSMTALYKLVTGFRAFFAIAQGATALGEGAIVAEGGVAALGASIAAIAGPVGIALVAIAALGLAVYGIVKAYQNAENAGKEATKALHEQIDTEVKALQAKVDLRKETRVLAAEYVNLMGNAHRTNDQTERMHNLYDQITALMPELTQGYDHLGQQMMPFMGKMIELISKTGLLTDKTLELAAAQKKLFLGWDPQITAADKQKADALTELNRLQTQGLRTGSHVEGSGEFSYNVDDFTKSGAAYQQALAKQKVAVEEATAKIKSLTDQLARSYDDLDGRHRTTAEAATKQKVKREEPFKVDPHVKDQAVEIIKQIGEGVKTSAGKASCADFASQVMKQAGLAVPHTLGAKALTDWFHEYGTQVDKAHAQALDLVSWHAPQYGAVQANGQRSGYHVGVYLGGNQVMDSTGGGHKTRSLFDEQHASFFHMAGGSLDKYQASQKENATEVDEATKALDEQKKVINDLFEKHVQLTASIHDSTEKTNAEKLAVEYAKDNVKNFGDELDKTTKKEMAAVMAKIGHKANAREITLEIQRENVALQQQADHLEALRKIQKIVTLQGRTNLVNAMQPQKKEMVEAFGTDNWFNNGIPDKMKQGFANSFYAGQDEAKIREFSKEWKELGRAQLEVLGQLQNEAPETALQKLNRQLAKLFEGIHDKKIIDDLKEFADSLRATAKEIDKLERFKGFNQINAPIMRNIDRLNTWKQGNVDQKSEAIAGFQTQNKEALGKMTPDLANEAVQNFATQWDLEKQVKQLTEMHEQLFAVQHAAEVLRTADPFQKWVKSFEQYDAATNSVKNPMLESAKTAGVNPHQIFDTKLLDDFNEKLQSVHEDTMRAAAEIAAADPFHKWLLQFETFNQALQQFQLPPGISQADLSKEFHFEQALAKEKDFANETRGIFDDVVKDLTTGKHFSFNNVLQSVLGNMSKNSLQDAQKSLGNAFSGLMDHIMGTHKPQTPANPIAGITQSALGKIASPSSGMGAITVTNFPAIQQISGTVSVDNLNQVGGGSGSSNSGGLIPGIGSGGGGDLGGDGGDDFSDFSAPGMVTANSLGGGSSMSAFNTPAYTDSSNAAFSQPSPQASVVHNYHMTYNVTTNNESMVRKTVSQSALDVARITQRAASRLG